MKGASLKGAFADRGLMMGAAVLILVIATACSSGTGTEAAPTVTSEPPPGFRLEPAAMTIETNVYGDVSGGTFTLEDGATALGCSSGTYVDSLWGVGHRKVFTCEAGEMTGTFAVNVNPDQVGIDPGPPETWTGTWGIDSAESTGDFVGLQGFGVFEVVFHPDGRPKVETLSGEIYG